MIEANGQYITADEIDVLEELKKQLHINGIERFAKIVPGPRNIQTNCPFHHDGQERKPSFGISTKDGVCHCFACGWAGSFAEMVSNVFGYNDSGIYGSRWLIKNFLTVEINNRNDIDLDFARVKKKESVHYVPEEELDKYRVYHPYMWKRKMTPEVVDIFDIGYDRNTQCLTFPIRDEQGHCLFVARRSVNTKFFHYPNDVAKPVYGVYEYKRDLEEKHKIGTWDTQVLTSGMYVAFDTQPVIICESMINAITCWVYGKYAVALNGTGTQQQIEQLRRMPNRKFILALDPDEAGEHGRERLRKGLTNKIVTEYIIPKGKDINDLSKDEFDALQEVFN